jgi:hypothetical protein
MGMEYKLGQRVLGVRCYLQIKPMIYHIGKFQYMFKPCRHVIVTMI